MKKNKAKGAVIFIFCVVLISVIASYAIWAVTVDVFAFNDKKEAPVNVTIPEGAELSDVAKIYKEAGLIKFPVIYELYAKLRGDDGKYLCGEFSLSPSLCYDELRGAIKNKSGTRAQIKLTFPEGSTVENIIDIFTSAGIGTREKFISVINEFDFGFDFLRNIKTEGRIYRLEGYLFPDTYYFYSDSTETEAIYKMLENFDRRFTSDMRKRAEENGFSVDEVLTLASIIEKEAYYKADMPYISSVFRNRLSSRSMPRLESDATVVYAVGGGKNTGSPIKEELGTDSPYNTYKVKGLPPGAICSPGLDAIEAAISPAQTDYYYFICTKKKTAVFSKTYAQHMKAIAADKNS